ncbi:hypothetical protein [Escherichia coli]|uniref:hypothetical protein n=1 Tax=Escherichia coli TaxID=562 RepID=UPI000A1835FE|nr:hypothetical protein [Escherichia coli]OSL96439.1 hypothetical protein EBAG_04544 [Escherichia coli T426]
MAGGIAFLVWAGSVSAVGQTESQASGGIPGILKYAQQYQQEEVPEEKGKAKEKRGRLRSGQRFIRDRV